MVYNSLPADKVSLIDLKSDILVNHSVNVSKVALHKKFTPEAVRFLKAVLNYLMSFNLDTELNKLNSASFFTCISIKDSSKFKLPCTYMNDYPSYGSFNTVSALMNLQFEYDLMNHKWKSIELTKATRNDQADSRETSSRIQQGGLYMRDLGYVTSHYLKAIQEKGAYYLNRLPKINVYQKNDTSYDQIDWNTLDQKIRKSGLQFYQKEVYIGKKEKIKTRIILIPVSPELAAKRVRDATRAGQRKKGYQISKEHRIKTRYNIFITNVPEKVLSREEIVSTYRLRWQIELIFKSWKSHLEIHKVKPVKTVRMECQLLAKLIWILITTKIYQFTQLISCSTGISQLKFFKLIRIHSRTMQLSLAKANLFRKWFFNLLIPLFNDLQVEKRLRKPTHHQALNNIISKLS